MGTLTGVHNLTFTHIRIRICLNLLGLTGAIFLDRHQHEFLRASVSKNQAKSEISGKNVKIQIRSNSGYW